MAKCFVSFSSRDGEFAAKLMASLRLQNADVWDYSNSAQDVALGAAVKESIRRRIDESGHFIAVLTPASTNPETGRFTIFEIEYARRNGIRMYPLTLQPFVPRALPAALAFLEDAKYLPFEASDDAAYERSFARLCEEMALSYSPPFLGDPRVIFAPRFEAEIRGLSIPNEHRILLRTVIDEYTRQYAAGKWEEAEETITFFIGACKRFLRGITLYYPMLLVAVCQMHKNDLGNAERTIRAVLHHPLCDENAWGALGQVHFLRGEYRAALESFKAAKEKCEPGKDWVARFNILAASVELGLPAAVSAAFTGFDLTSRPIDDQVKIANLQASLFSRQNDWRAIIATLRDIYERQIGNAASAVYLADAYERLGRFRDALLVLSNEAERLQNRNLYHHLSTLHARMRNPIAALEIYERHLLDDPDRPHQMMTDYAILLRSLGRMTECQSICRRAIDLEVNRSRSEHYFRGLAYYLLGRVLDAQVWYQESKFPEPFYDALMPSC